MTLKERAIAAIRAFRGAQKQQSQWFVFDYEGTLWLSMDPKPDLHSWLSDNVGAWRVIGTGDLCGTIMLGRSSKAMGSTITPTT